MSLKLTHQIEDHGDINQIGRFAYMSCLQSALLSVMQARELVRGDVTDGNHDLPAIEHLIRTAIAVS